jgi:hypothetical protein
VVLDGEPVGVTPWTAEIPPGGHRLQLRLPGYRDGRTRFELAADRATDVSLALSRGASSEGLGPDGGQTGVAKIGPVAWTSLAVGVAGLGAALGCELARGNAEDDARTAPTQAESGEDYARMEDLRTASRVLLGIGAAATLTGGVLLAVDLASEPSGQSPEEDDASLQAALGCRAGACGLGLSGQF